MAPSLLFVHSGQNLEQNNSGIFFIHKEFTNILLTVWQMPAKIRLALNE